MNPQGSDHLPSLDLPKPQAEQFTGASEVLPIAPAGEAENAKAIEQNGQVPQAVPTPQMPLPVMTTPIMPAPAQPVVAQQGSAASAPPIADDVDLIEKEWVERAKQIVDQTKHDPYQQNKELNRIKADYLRKRYNKEIKLEE